MKKRSSEKRLDLVIFGEFFSDMIFYDLPDRPRLGEEIKTDSFLIAPGGLATTAQAASRLGTTTAIITRVGADAASLPTWCELLEQGLDVSVCEVREDLPTALTVCVAYDADRMMVTYEPINRNLEALLEKKPILRKLRSARHVHLACALRRPKKWLPVLKMLKGEGISLSADFGWNPGVPIEEIRSILHSWTLRFRTSTRHRHSPAQTAPPKLWKSLGHGCVFRSSRWAAGEPCCSQPRSFTSSQLWRSGWLTPPGLEMPLTVAFCTLFSLDRRGTTAFARAISAVEAWSPHPEVPEDSHPRQNFTATFRRCDPLR